MVSGFLLFDRPFDLYLSIKISKDHILQSECSSDIVIAEGAETSSYRLECLLCDYHGDFYVATNNSILLSLRH